MTDKFGLYRQKPKGIMRKFFWCSVENKQHEHEFSYLLSVKYCIYNKNINLCGVKIINKSTSLKLSRLTSVCPVFYLLISDDHLSPTMCRRCNLRQTLTTGPRSHPHIHSSNYVCRELLRVC